MLSLLSVLSVANDNLVIARKGESSPYKIVISKEDEYHNQRLSADQFKGFVMNITGVELQIITDDEPLPSKAIIIGMTKYTKKACYYIKNIDPETDAFHWVSTGDYIVLNGGRRGLPYGVFELFERYANVRFYSTWMFVVPPSDTFEIPAELDFYSKADFFYRETYDSDLFESYLWNLYQRYDTGENYVQGGLGNTKRGAGCHTILGHMKSSVFPVSKYPERYALKTEGGTARSSWQPCLSNKGTFDTVLESVLAEAKATPNKYFIDVSQNDGNTYCHCPECTKKFMRYGNRTSGMWIDFLNRIAVEVVKKYPKMNIRTLAYVNSMLPPKNIRVHPNIMIRLCEYTTDHSIPVEESDYSYSIEFMDALKGWSRLTKNIMVWIYSYNYMATELIHPNWFTIGKDMKTFKKYGILGTFFDAPLPDADAKDSIRQFTDFDKLKGYINGKLLWNASLDENDLMNDFLRGYYGPKAAPYVRQFLDDAYYEVKEYHKGNYEPLYCDAVADYDVYLPLRNGFLDHGFNLWQRAIAAASTDTDPRFLYNTQTGSVSTCMSIFKYHKEFDMPSKWTLESIKQEPSNMFYKIAKNIPQYCPDRVKPDPRSNRVCDLGNMKNDLYARDYFNFTTSVEVPNIITCGQSKFGSKEGFYYGRGGILQKDNWNYLDYNNGGFDFNFIESWVLTYHQYRGYHLNQTEKGKFQKIADNSYTSDFGAYQINKKYAAAGEGVKGTFSLTFNQVPQCQTINSVVSINCKLDDSGDSIVWQRGDRWDKYTLHPNQKASHAGFKDNAKVFTIASPNTKRGMQFVVNRDPEFVSIEVNRTSKTYRVFICFKEIKTTNSAAEVTITPLQSVSIPTNVNIKKNEYFEGKEISEFMSYIDTVESNNKFKRALGGDEKAESGFAVVTDYLGKDNVNIRESPKYNVVRMTSSTYINGVHWGDSYNFSSHIRCDIVDPNKPAFTAFYMDNYAGMPWGRDTRSNVSDYIWIHRPIYNISEHQHFYIQPLSGAKRCYVDKFRLVPIKLSPTYKPPRVPKFTIKDLPPMPPVDLYKSIEFGDGINHKAAMICELVIVIIGVCVIIGALIYKKYFATPPEESDSVVNETVSQSLI